MQLFKQILRFIFLFLNGINKLYVRELLGPEFEEEDEQEIQDVSTTIIETETDTTKSSSTEEPKFINLDHEVKAAIRAERTPENTIKLTLDIIIGSNGLGVFLISPPQFSNQPFERTPTPPPCPIPDPVDDTPKIDDFNIDLNFGPAIPPDTENITEYVILPPAPAPERELDSDDDDDSMPELEPCSPYEVDTDDEAKECTTAENQFMKDMERDWKEYVSEQIINNIK